MKSVLKTIKLFVCVIYVIGLNSCGLIPDKEIEKNLAGTWKTTQIENEDGMTMKMVETVTYYYNKNGDNTFDTELQIKITSPISMNIGTVSYSGTWSASKKKMIQEINKNSVNFSFNNLLDSSDKQDFKSDFYDSMKECDYTEGGELISISPNEFSLRDEEENEIYNYTRLN